MRACRFGIVIQLILTIFVGIDDVCSESVKLVGPTCGSLFDGGREEQECGSTLTFDQAQNSDLGSLCKSSDRLKLGVVRDDVDIEGIVIFSPFHHQMILLYNI